MEENTTALISVGIFAFLFCFAVIMAIYYGDRTKKELSGQPGVYKGFAGEPRWNGKLPAKADPIMFNPAMFMKIWLKVPIFYLKTAELSVIASVLI